MRLLILSLWKIVEKKGVSEVFQTWRTWPHFWLRHAPASLIKTWLKHGCFVLDYDLFAAYGTLLYGPHPALIRIVE
jgi:hypothetical protein